MPNIDTMFSKIEFIKRFNLEYIYENQNEFVFNILIMVEKKKELVKHYGKSIELDNEIKKGIDLIDNNLKKLVGICEND